jgi:hypothetical protein
LDIARLQALRVAKGEALIVIQARKAAKSGDQA